MSDEELNEAPEDPGTDDETIKEETPGEDSESVKLTDLIPDDKNFNRGNEFGNHLIDVSMHKFGAGRSILIDKNRKIIAGNKTHAKALDNEIEDVQIIKSDGKKLIAVQREDIDLDTPIGREMALADNAAAKANIEWDEENLKGEDFGLEPEDMEEFFGDWGVEAPMDVPVNLLDDNIPLKEEAISPVDMAHFLISVPIDKADYVMRKIQEIQEMQIAEIESNVN